MPETQEQLLIDDVVNGQLGSIQAILERFRHIHNCYNELRWSWSYHMILDYYGIQELDDAAVERIRADYVEARRKWIALIKQDAEKEYSLGDIEPGVFNDFIDKLDHEVDFENQRLYM